MRKIVFIIPGYGETLNDKGYKEAMASSRKKGMHPIFIPIAWKRTTIHHWISQARSVYLKHWNPDAQIIGFSFGAYIAIFLSKEHPCKKLILCSLSPYFKDDIPTLPPIAEKMLGKRRMLAFSEYSFPKMHQRTVFMVGDKDPGFVITRVKKSFKKWKRDSSLVIVKNTEHDFGSIKYVDALNKQI